MKQEYESILLDVTRLVSRTWTRRSSTGIDRVCEAYCRHLRSRSRAVVQFRGVVKVLSARDSQHLFDVLLDPTEFSRRGIVRFALGALARAPSRIEGAGRLYINTSHTDFDLQVHHDWIESNDLRPVYFVHDLIPINNPNLSSQRAVERHLGRVLGALSSAAGVIVNSAATKQDLMEFAAQHRLSPPPILTATLAGQNLSAQVNSDQGHVSDANEAIPDGNTAYFVCVGTIERRKNYELLLRVWSRLKARLGQACPMLIIIGQLGPQSGHVMKAYRAKPELKDLVRFVTDAPDAQLGKLVAGARGLLMPTLAEGFGLPMLEALQLGTPVIASDIPSLREIGQGIPLFIERSNDKGWEQAIETFSDPGSDRDRQLGLMPEFVNPTWDSHFSTVDHWLNSLGRSTASPDESLINSCLHA